MKASKELQGFYKTFRAIVYVLVPQEFFDYAIDPAVFDQWVAYKLTFTGVS